MKKMFRIGVKKSKRTNRVQLVDLQGKPNAPVVMMIPYGVFMNPKTNTPVAVLADQGNEESLYGIPFEIDVNNLETLEDGEIAFGIPDKTARLKFFDNDKLALYNDLISMKDILIGILDEMKAIGTTGSPTNHVVNPPSQANIELFKLEVEKLFNGP